MGTPSVGRVAAGMRAAAGAAAMGVPRATWVGVGRATVVARPLGGGQGTRPIPFRQGVIHSVCTPRDAPGTASDGRVSGV